MIKVEKIEDIPVSSYEVEIVERKGLGHPDTICDLLAEKISFNLSKLYLSQSGRILHYNIDKILLSAGKTEKFFGGGRFLQPIKIFIGDRATYFSDDKQLPINNIVISTVKKWFKKNIKNLDTNNIETNVLLLEGSEELTNIFESNSRILPANDTSVGIGYYPLTPLERITLLTENYLNSYSFKKVYPFTGEDVKVMAFRYKNDLDLTVAMPFICKFVKSEKDYFKLKRMVYENLKNFLEERWSYGKVNINFNSLDEEGKCIRGLYLTLTGTSAEDADSGEVGRGNRANGLISFMRPLGSEAVAGKNPISHIGKIYNFFAFYLAEKIYKNFSDLKDVYVYLLSKIGSPVNKPHCVYIKVLPLKEKDNGFYERINEYAKKEIANLDNFCKKLISGKISIK